MTRTSYSSGQLLFCLCQPSSLKRGQACPFSNVTVSYGPVCLQYLQFHIYTLSVACQLSRAGVCGKYILIYLRTHIWFLDTRLTDGDEVVRLTRRPPLTSLGRFLVLTSVRGWVNLRAIVRLERLGKLKNLMASLGIEPTTFWLVA
jgi:hypothetical protein